MKAKLGQHKKLFHITPLHCCNEKISAEMEKKNHYKGIPEVGRERNHVDIQENLGA